MFATYSSTTFFWRESEMTLGVVRDCFKGFRIWTAYVWFPLTSVASCISRDLFLRLKLISPASAIQTDHPKLLPYRRRRLRYNSDSALNHAKRNLWEWLICEVTGANEFLLCGLRCCTRAEANGVRNGNCVWRLGKQPRGNCPRTIIAFVRHSHNHRRRKFRFRAGGSDNFTISIKLWELFLVGGDLYLRVMLARAVVKN